MRIIKSKSALIVGIVAIFTLTAFSAPSSPPTESTRSIPGWGNVIDPSGDCTLTMADGKLTLALPGTDHALMPETGRTNAPRVLQNVTNEFDVQVKVSCDFPTDPKSVVPGRHPYQDAGLLVWLDNQNYLKLSRAQIHVGAKSFNYFHLDFRYGGQYGELPFPKEARQLLPAKAIYLRLQIHAGMTAAAVSAGGKTWITTYLPGEDKPENVQVGIIAENNTSSPLTATFEEFSCQKIPGK